MLYSLNLENNTHFWVYGAQTRYTLYTIFHNIMRYEVHKSQSSDDFVYLLRNGPLEWNNHSNLARMD